MRTFYKGQRNPFVQMGTEVLCSYQVGKVNLTLEQDLVFSEKEKFFSFSVFAEKDGKYSCKGFVSMHQRDHKGNFSFIKIRVVSKKPRRCSQCGADN